MPTYDPHLDALIDLTLAEDVATGDVTTESCVAASTRATATVVAKSPLVLAGSEAFTRVFERVDAGVEVMAHKQDGDSAAPGDVVFALSGSARSLLIGERAALNFLQRLAGVATLTREMVDALRGHPGTSLVDTRKTTPGFRRLEKRAVRAGGGVNHRFGLFDGVLIKENHIEAAGGIPEAVRRARIAAHHLLKIEVETTTLDEVDEALTAGADVILLDNMDNDTLRAARAKADAHKDAAGHRALLEASGNMSLARLPGVAEAGVDLISVGALTHSAKSADLSMRLTLGKG